MFARLFIRKPTVFSHIGFFSGPIVTTSISFLYRNICLSHTLLAFYGSFSFSSRMDGKFYETRHLIANVPRRTLKNHWSDARQQQVDYFFFRSVLWVSNHIMAVAVAATRCLASGAKATDWVTWTYLWIFTQIHIRNDMNNLLILLFCMWHSCKLHLVRCVGF